MPALVAGIHVFTAAEGEGVDGRDKPGHDARCNPPLDVRTHRPILNQMVYYPTDRLDQTFAAIADPTRRALLAQLKGRDDIAVSELAKPFAMSLPAVMKHLDVLSDAGLIARTKTGRTVTCRLTAGPMEDAMKWLNRYQRFWTEQLDRLAAFVEEEPCLPNQASPSPAGSTPRPRKSSRRGPTPKK
jgi:DNA-binding transcriptional ArsR family regulator